MGLINMDWKEIIKIKEEENIREFEARQSGYPAGGEISHEDALAHDADLVNRPSGVIGMDEWERLAEYVDEPKHFVEALRKLEEIINSAEMRGGESKHDFIKLLAQIVGKVK